MRRISGITLLILIITILTATPSFAEESQPQSGHHGMQAHGSMPHGNMDRKKKAHHFSPQWSQTLSDDQKTSVDRMHLDLERKLVVLKAQAELAQKELNAYTIRDDAKISTISSMINKLLAVDKQILESRYAHLLEMRNILTAEQRVSYDMSVLNRHGSK
jgi:Spy/CpxP family protein refolding chaperone